MLFIRLYSRKKSIVHVSDQLMQVWSVCWVETNTNSAELMLQAAACQLVIERTL